MSSDKHMIIPDDEKQCVWMDAGLVNYKLCGSNFNCDSCPFDSVMRDEHRTFSEQVAERNRGLFENLRSDSTDLLAEFKRRNIDPLRAIALPPDRIYFPNQTWMRSHHDGTFTVGINEFVARLMFPITGVAAIHAPSHIGRGELFAWLIRGSTTFGITSVEEGYAVSTNPKLIDHPSLIASDPYGEGWLMQLSCTNVASPDLKFFTADDFRPTLSGDIDRLWNMIAAGSRSATRTMLDGGMSAESIEECIGEKRYARFLSGLLHPH